jgi:hypothetical protein
MLHLKTLLIVAASAALTLVLYVWLYHVLEGLRDCSPDAHSLEAQRARAVESQLRVGMCESTACPIPNYGQSSK